jgi:APA family basic amino acid/polyamine antiporter
VTRRLNLFDATMLVMGGIVGVGIFFTPRAVAQAVPSPGAFLLAWAIGGCVALMGAQTFAELGGTFPRAGGWYVFLREIWGRFVAFLFAWVVLCVISTGAIAVMMSFFTDTVRTLWPALGPAGGARSMALGAGVILGITALSMCGVKAGATFQNLCMLVKLAAIAGLVVGGLFLFDAQPAVASTAPAPATGELARGMIAAILPVLFACGGWQMVCYVAPQVENPQRTLPRAILFGVLGVVAVYLAANAAYLRVLGIEGLIAPRTSIATDMALATLGPHGGTILSAAMAISALGVCTVTIIGTPWLYVAMAREGMFFERFGALHPKTGAPIAGLAAQAVFCLAYWFWGRAEVLVNSVVFVEWIFHALVAVGLMRLRALRPELPRPFRSFAYPLAPLLYVLIACGVVLGNVVEANVRDTVIGLSVLLLGALVYPLWRRLMEQRRTDVG